MKSSTFQHDGICVRSKQRRFLSIVLLIAMNMFLPLLVRRHLYFGVLSFSMPPSNTRRQIEQGNECNLFLYATARRVTSRYASIQSTQCCRIVSRRCSLVVMQGQQSQEHQNPTEQNSTTIRINSDLNDTLGEVSSSSQLTTTRRFRRLRRLSLRQSRRKKIPGAKVDRSPRLTALRQWPGSRAVRIYTEYAGRLWNETNTEARRRIARDKAAAAVRQVQQILLIQQQQQQQSESSTSLTASIMNNKDKEVPQELGYDDPQKVQALLEACHEFLEQHDNHKTKTKDNAKRNSITPSNPKTNGKMGLSTYSLQPLPTKDTASEIDRNQAIATSVTSSVNETPLAASSVFKNVQDTTGSNGVHSEETRSGLSPSYNQVTSREDTEKQTMSTTLTSTKEPIASESTPDSMGQGVVEETRPSIIGHDESGRRVEPAVVLDELSSISQEMKTKSTALATRSGEVVSEASSSFLEKKPKKKRGRRSILFGALMGVVVACWVFSGNYIFTGLFTLMTILGQLEYYRMVINTGVYPARRISIVGASSMFLTALFCPQHHQIILPLFGLWAMIWFLTMKRTVTTIPEIATTFTGMFYLGYVPSFWVRTRLIGLGREPTRLAPIVEPWLNLLHKQAEGSLPPAALGAVHLPITTGAIFIFWTWLCLAFSDVAAYFVGKNLGRTPIGKLAPAAGATSPNKTVEGVIGGCVVSALLGICGKFKCTNNEKPVWFVF